MASDLLKDMAIYRLWVTSRTLEREAEMDLQSCGLTFQSALILIIIGDEELCRPKDIAQKASLSAAAVSRTLRGLEDKELVETQTRRENRRESRVILTDAGEQLRQRSLQVFKEKAALVKAQLSDEEFNAVMMALAKISLAGLRHAA